MSRDICQATTSLCIRHFEMFSYRVCGVLSCNNTTIKTPEKLFVHVPLKPKEFRNKWLQLAGRNPSKISTKSELYFCEDHFNLEADMDNFMEYKIMGSVKKIRMKPSCVPSKLVPNKLDRPNNTAASGIMVQIPLNLEMEHILETPFRLQTPCTSSTITKIENEMPSIDQTVTELPTMTSSIEVFHSFKPRDDSKESDDESLHLQLEEDDNEEKIDEGPSENEDEILHKFDPEYKKCNGDAEETSDNKEETREESEKQETEKDSEKDKPHEANGDGDKQVANEEVKEIQDNSTETIKNTTEEASSEDDNNKEGTSVGNSEDPPPVTVEETGTSNSSVEKIDEVVNAEDKDDKCENDTEEDLLDISKVRDVEEDNADNASNEECDEDTSDKMENDEIPNEQTNNKSDEVDIEETNLEMNCNEEDKSKELIEETDEDKNNESTVNTSHDVEMTDDVNSETRNSSKRSLDSNDSNNSNSDGSNLIKRQRLEENLQTVQNKLSDNNNKESQIPIVLQSIDYFKDFMKKKNYKISVYDLEEMCLEKTSEVIQYCSKLGDARHQIQLQKQLVESLRKELQQVMKQTRDLEIVNRKLMGDVKQCMAALSAATATTKTTTGEQTEVATTTTPPKPLQPLKITRSVGLQVRFTTPFETATITTKRRQSVILPHQKIPIVSITNNKNAKSINSATPIRQQAVIQKTATTNQSSPILTQALTSSRKSDTNNKLPVQGARPRVATATAAPSSSSSSSTTTTTSITTPSIIDLTDEDDRQNRRVSTITTAAATTTTTTTGQNRNTVARNSLPLRQNNQIQSVRTVTSNVRLTASSSSTPSSSSTISTTKQINSANGTITTTQTPMYLLQSIPQTMLTSSLTTAAKVVLSLQSPNGLLNGSTVTIQRPTAPSIQLKPVHALKAPSVVTTTTTNTTTINGVSGSSNSSNNRRSPNQHPAPLPLPPPPPPNKFDKFLKPIPPKPHLTIRKTDSGIILQWKMPYELDMYEIIASYQLFAYQETNATPDTDMWRRVGDVKALALPMACTLTQFADNNKYYFAVRPVDIHKRIGAFSDPEEISL